MRDLGQLRIRQDIHPLTGRNVADMQSFRDDYKTEIEAIIASGQEPTPSVRLVMETEETVQDLSHIVRTMPREVAAAWLHHHGRAPRVLRRFRVGVETLPLRGAVCRVVAILELLPGASGQPDRWWLARRMIGLLGDQLSFIGNWEDTEGVGADELDPPFRTWIETGHNGKLSADIHRAVRTPAEPIIRTRVEDLPGPPPADARTAAEWACMMIRADALAGRFDEPRVIVFRETAVEDYLVESLSHCTLDDFVRNVVGLAPVVAVVVLRPADAKDPADGTERQAIIGIAECPDHAWIGGWHIVPRDVGQVDVPLVYEEHKGPDDLRVWIGVEPRVKLGIGMPTLNPLED